MSPLLDIVALLGGAAWRRWLGAHGTGPRGLKLVVALALGFLLMWAQVHWLWAGVLSILIALSMITGHGAYMDMGRSPPDDEWFGFLVPDILNPFWRDYVGMVLRYGIPSLVIAGVVIYLSGPVGAIVLLWGPLVATGYALAWKYLSHPTMYGEFVIGTIWGVVSFALG